MEKLTDMVAQLTKKPEDRDWDFCILYVKDKQPIMVTKETPITTDGTVMTMESLSPHPFPQNRQDQDRMFKVVNHFESFAIQAVDYFYEKKIISRGGSQLHIN